MLKASRGVTLIELIVGIVVLAIALSIITAILGPLYIKSADPWHQVRAAELGHSLMNEILGKSFDENSNRSGGLLRCDEDGAENCSCTATEVVLAFYRCTAGSDYFVFGPNGETRSQFNDVDDYHGLVQN
ncbi:MAG TPA: prepilin-type N-terminal cleavage/methylation domain-containing protein, partial [Rheinheimera sp.]|nr:prepilin-type N-terminal cleavage/methylation domain-containing protein [Rheinheimera sp.]